MRQILLASLLTLASLIEEGRPICEEDYQTLTLDVMNELASKLEALADGTKYSYGEAHTHLRDAITRLGAQYSRRLKQLKEDGMFGKFLQDVHSYCRVKHAFKQMLRGRRAEPGRYGNEKVCDDLKREISKEREECSNTGVLQEILSHVEIEVNVAKFALDLFGDRDCMVGGFHDDEFTFLDNYVSGNYLKGAKVNRETKPKAESTKDKVHSNKVIGDDENDLINGKKPSNKISGEHFFDPVIKYNKDWKKSWIINRKADSMKDKEDSKKVIGDDKYDLINGKMPSNNIPGEQLFDPEIKFNKTWNDSRTIDRAGSIKDKEDSKKVMGNDKYDLINGKKPSNKISDEHVYYPVNNYKHWEESRIKDQKADSNKLSGVHEYEYNKARKTSNQISGDHKYESIKVNKGPHKTSSNNEYEYNKGRKTSSQISGDHEYESIKVNKGPHKTSSNNEYEYNKGRKTSSQISGDHEYESIKVNKGPHKTSSNNEYEYNKGRKTSSQISGDHEYESIKVNKGPHKTSSNNEYEYNKVRQTSSQISGNHEYEFFKGKNYSNKKKCDDEVDSRNKI